MVPRESRTGYNRVVRSSVIVFLATEAAVMAQMIGLPQAEVTLAGTLTAPLIINNSSHWILAYTLVDQDAAGHVRPHTYDMIGQLRNNPRAGIAPGASFSEAQLPMRTEIRDASGAPPPPPTQVSLDQHAADAEGVGSHEGLSSILLDVMARCRIETTECEISLLLPAPTPPIKVYLPEPKDQTEDPVLIIWGRGFSSDAHALSTGAAVKASVMLAGLLLGVGIDVGTDLLASPSAQF